MLTEISPIGLNLMTATYTGMLTAFGWLIITQINTNRAFRQAINEFKTTLEVMDYRYKNQQQVCSKHIEQTEKLENDLTDLKIKMITAPKRRAPRRS